jgi:hypothetical protein
LVFEKRRQKITGLERIGKDTSRWNCHRIVKIVVHRMNECCNLFHVHELKQRWRINTLLLVYMNHHHGKK